MESLINKIFYIFLFLLISLDLLSCKKLKNNFVSFTDDDEITTITSDNETEFLVSIEKLNRNGGTIYIDTPVITINERFKISISGQLPGDIIGKRQPNGEYPRINFIKKKHKELFWN